VLHLNLVCNFFCFMFCMGFCCDNHCGGVVLFHFVSFVLFILCLGDLNPRKGLGALECEEVVLKKTW
jgi:hypothetical protein